MTTHSNNDVQARFRRMRLLILSLIIILVLALSATPLIVSTYLDQQIDEVQIEIDCSNARYNQKSLDALSEIADRLGIPHEFGPTPLPEGCM